MEKQSVLVTGSSRGIGKAIALAFSRRGYKVFINCRKSLKDLEEVKEEITRRGGLCTALLGDVKKPRDVREIFRRIQEECPGLDVLVNNAGVSYVGLITDMQEEDWEEIIGSNLSSAFYCSRAALPYMIRKKKGKIINVSSVWGICGASCEVAYSAAKAGLNGLTKALAKELAPSNIQVNAIACGVVDTKMNAIFSREEKKKLQERIPAGRFALPSEVAALALDLSENHPYMTGQIIALDGGFI